MSQQKISSLDFRALIHTHYLLHIVYIVHKIINVVYTKSISVYVRKRLL